MIEYESAVQMKTINRPLPLVRICDIKMDNYQPGMAITDFILEECHIRDWKRYERSCSRRNN